MHMAIKSSDNMRDGINHIQKSKPLLIRSFSENMYSSVREVDWTTGMVEYWNGGLGNFCSCFYYLSYYIYFLVIGRSLLHLLCSWIPRFEDY